MGRLITFAIAPTSRRLETRSFQVMIRSRIFMALSRQPEHNERERHMHSLEPSESNARNYKRYALRPKRSFSSLLTTCRACKFIQYHHNERCYRCLTSLFNLPKGRECRVGLAKPRHTEGMVGRGRDLEGRIQAQQSYIFYVSNALRIHVLCKYLPGLEQKHSGKPDTSIL
ncbi:hypothetical protein BDZ97DRAFT_1295666 [Flammula alnicola]|nr:hypothetical protein BDZ97DRAFT_1295666 [Flammula alnicola]